MKSNDLNYDFSNDTKKSGICIKPSVLYNKKKNKKKNTKNVNVHDWKRTDYWVWCLTPLSTNFSVFSFIGGVKRRAHRIPRTCHKSLANFIT